MKKRVVRLLLAGLCVLTLGTGAVMAQQQRALCGKLIRLHVVANSDTQEDQALKLQVRDAVLSQAQVLLQDAEDPQAALVQGLDVLQSAAQRTLRAAGCTDAVQVSFQNERFATRVYDTFTLPAGVYRTVRVTIGAGAGHNWWCVVFPSLCMASSVEELEQAAQAAGMTDGEVRLIAGDSGTVQIRFRTLELIEQVKKFLTDR